MSTFPLYSASLSQLVGKVQKGKWKGNLVAFDPGETTGCATYRWDGERCELLSASQEQAWPLKAAVRNFADVLDIARPNFVVYEAYHVYKWKLEEHTFSRVPTLQIIGCIRTLCIQNGIPNDEQTAQTGKGFCTDDKLRAWGLHLPGFVHARDAIRHGAHWLLFHKDQV
jgi:hypothetical protein